MLNQIRAPSGIPPRVTLSETRYYGFAPGLGSEDRIQFSAGAGLPTTFAEVLARATEAGVGTVITIDNSTSITLQGIVMASLSADDFRFG